MFVYVFWARLRMLVPEPKSRCLGKWIHRSLESRLLFPWKNILTTKQHGCCTIMGSTINDRARLVYEIFKPGCFFWLSIVNNSEPPLSLLLISQTHTLMNVLIVHKNALRPMGMVGQLICTRNMAAVKAVALTYTSSMRQLIGSNCPIYDSELRSYLDEEYTTNSKKSPNMCIVTLSVLDKCRHELATIDYCKKADEKANETNLDSGEATTPRETCTESLGWLIYKSLTVRPIGRIDE